MVTAAIVMCVVANVYSTICHQVRFHNPLASQSMAMLITALSGRGKSGFSIGRTKVRLVE